MLRNPLHDFEVVLEAEVKKEETLESIVPDISPDVAEVVFTSGMAVLREKEIREGEMCVSGVVRVTALCRPEDAGEQTGLCRLECAIPFTHTFSGDITADSGGSVRVWTEQTSARVLNPRKVLFSVTVGVTATAWQPRERHICVGLVSDTDTPEVLRTARRLYLPIAVRDKSFGIADDWEIPAGKPPVGEVLHTTVSLIAGESKPVGSKLIFKGDARLNMLYTAAGEFDELVWLEHVIPFSQIMEADGLEEDNDVTLVIVPCGFEITPKVGMAAECRSLEVSIQALAQMTACTERDIAPLSDAYSTRFELEPTIDQLDAPELTERGERRVSVREILGVMGEVSRVIASEAVVGAVGVQEQDGKVSVTAEVFVRVLYFGEDGTPRAVEGMIMTASPPEFTPGTTVRAEAAIGNELYAAPSADGVEVRFTVQFAVTVCRPGMVDVLTGVADQPAPRDMSNWPSVVLRPIAAGESLWDAAKAYGSSMSGICRVNGLEMDAPLEAGRTLLIPKGQ